MAVPPIRRWPLIGQTELQHQPVVDGPVRVRQGLYILHGLAGGQDLQIGGAHGVGRGRGPEFGIRLAQDLLGGPLKMRGKGLD